MYEFYLDDEKLPLPPSKFTTTVNNSNTTVDLLSIGDVNVIKDIGLRDFSLEVLLPGKPYPFVSTLDSFKIPIYYLVKFREIKESKKPVRLIITRILSNQGEIFSTNIKVSIEDYTVEEIAGEEGDIHVILNLKEYRKPMLKVIEVQNNSDGTSEVTEEIQREEKEKATEYTVVSGDSLWKIAKRELNDGSRYKEIAQLNGIQDPNRINVGQVLRLP